EPAAGDPLGDAGPVEVGGDPAEVERPPGAEDHAEVDVLRGGDDPLVQHDADLVGERVERAGEDLLLRGRVRPAGEDLHDLGVEGEVGQVHAGLAGRDELRQVVRQREPVGERLEIGRAHV